MMRCRRNRIIRRSRIVSISMFIRHIRFRYRSHRVRSRIHRRIGSSSSSITIGVIHHIIRILRLRRVTHTAIRDIYRHARRFRTSRIVIRIRSHIIIIRIIAIRSLNIITRACLRLILPVIIHLLCLHRLHHRILIRLQFLHRRVTPHILLRRSRIRHFPRFHRRHHHRHLRCVTFL